MIKSLFKIFYNNILSLCYDTQKNTQDDIIINFNNYENLNFDYKILKKKDFYDNNTLLHAKHIDEKATNQDNNTFIECYKSDFEDKCDIISDFEDKCDMVSDFD